MSGCDLDRIARLEGIEPELAMRLAWASDLWIFAYGSLMWEPGFAFCEAVPAMVRGYHRRFCVYSHGYRGTPERPGLVLGLDRGGACKGIAYRVPAVDVPTALTYLWDREMKSGVYRLKELSVAIPGGEATAVAFVVARSHARYAPGLTELQTARLIRQGVGKRGTSVQYLENTTRELERLGVVDAALHRLERRVRSMGDAPLKKAA
jgi:glutathione-specific gamma-glutamylcyclotransferase